MGHNIICFVEHHGNNCFKSRYIFKYINSSIQLFNKSAYWEKREIFYPLNPKFPRLIVLDCRKIVNWMLYIDLPTLGSTDCVEFPIGCNSCNYVLFPSRSSLSTWRVLRYSRQDSSIYSILAFFSFSPLKKEKTII